MLYTCGQVIAGRPLVIVTVSSPVSLHALPPLSSPTHSVCSSSPLTSDANQHVAHMLSSVFIIQPHDLTHLVRVKLMDGNV